MSSCVIPQLFVSHASEDKAAFVRPLAHALKAHGLKVWYDEFSLKIGDSLRRSIDHGLVECTAGIVVLSKSFFAKEWPQRELDALYSAEASGRSRLIPVWYDIDHAMVASVSPLLADRIAIKATEGVKVVARLIADQFEVPPRQSGTELAEVLTSFQTFGLFAGEANYAGCKYRFLTMNAFAEEYNSLAAEAINHLTNEELEDFPSELDQRLNKEMERLRGKYRLPDDVYLELDEPIREEHLASYCTTMCEWVSGTLSRAESAELVRDLDLAELDEYFILLNVPNFSISGEQRQLLELGLVELGCGLENEYCEVNEICTALRALDKDT